MMPSDFRWERGGGYWYGLLNSSGVEGKKEKSLSARRLREE